MEKAAVENLKIEANKYVTRYKDRAEFKMTAITPRPTPKTPTPVLEFLTNSDGKVDEDSPTGNAQLDWMRKGFVTGDPYPTPTHTTADLKRQGMFGVYQYQDADAPAVVTAAGTNKPKLIEWVRNANAVVAPDGLILGPAYGTPKPVGLVGLYRVL